jgi:myosin heavy subunit
MKEGDCMLIGNKRQAGQPAHRGQAQAGKLLVPLLAALAVTATCLAAFALVLQRQERSRVQAKALELQQALSQNEELRAKLDDIEQAKSAIEQQVTRLQEELTRAKDDLASATSTHQTLTQSVEDREKEITRLNEELTQAKSESSQTKNQVSVLQNERDTMKRQLTDLEKAKNELESKVIELSSARPTIELDKVIVGTELTIPMAGQADVLPVGTLGSSDGQVVVINREYDFIVMNLGKNQGLTVGQEFQIVRDNQVLGRVKVEKVYDELSAAAILPNSQKDSIREGDVVQAM